MSARRVLQIGFWLAALALLWFIWSRVPLTAVWQSLRRLSFSQILILAGLNGLIVALLTGRWWLILWGTGFRLPFGLTVGHRLAAFGLSYVTPGPQFGGEPVQVLLVEQQHGVPRTTAISSVALDKSLELLVNFTFLAGGTLLILRDASSNTAFGPQAALLALTMLAFPALYLLALWRRRQPITGFMQLLSPLVGRHGAWSGRYRTAVAGLGASEVQAGRFCHEATRFLVSALLVSCLGWLFMVLEFAAMLRFLGADLTIAQAIMVLTAVRFAFLLPLPGGLGTVEVALVLALTQLGLEPAAGLSAALLIRGRDLLLALFGLWWGNVFFRVARAGMSATSPATQKEISDDQFT